MNNYCAFSKDHHCIKWQAQEGHIVMEYEKVLGAHIKDIRKRRNMTQEILAELVGVTSQHISNIETGKTALYYQTIIMTYDLFSCIYN